MPKTRVILELGSGNDLHGSDYTKAALRAVQDALHHGSLSLIRSLHVDKPTLALEVPSGVQRPEQGALAMVQAALPHGPGPCTAGQRGEFALAFEQRQAHRWISRNR